MREPGSVERAEHLVECLCGRWVGQRERTDADGQDFLPNEQRVTQHEQVAGLLIIGGEPLSSSVMVIRRPNTAVLISMIKAWLGDLLDGTSF